MLNFEEKICSACRLALGRCITTLASQLRQHCPTIAPPAFQNPPGERTIQSRQIPGLVPGLLPGAAAGPSAPFGNGQMPLSFLGVPIGEQAGNSMPAQQLAVSDEALPVLEAAYGLYMDHFVLGGNEHGANHWTAALEAVQPVRPHLFVCSNYTLFLIELHRRPLHTFRTLDHNSPAMAAS